MTAAAMPSPSSGRFIEGVHVFPVRVYFEDTDLTGVVYHANYLRFMERARSDMLRLAGIDQRATHEAGAGAYAIARLDMQYRKPARLDDDLIVESRVTAIAAASTTIAQTIRRGPDVLTHGTVTAALVSPAGRPLRQPAAWTAIFHSLTQGYDPS